MAGPVQLANVVDHILKSRRLQGLEAKIDDISNVGVFKDRQADYNYLLGKLDRAKDPKAKKEVKRRRGRLGALEEELAPLVLMARRPTDKFRGERIGDGSREIVVKSINCPMKDDATQVTFRRLAAKVQSYVTLTLQERKQKWEQGGRAGPEPCQRSVEINLFGGSNVRARLSGRSGHAWTRLMRAGVYPALARLMEADMILDEDLHHGTINPLGAQACKAYLAHGRAAMVEVLKGSSLWRCRRELAQESTKFAKLRKLVDDMQILEGHSDRVKHGSSFGVITSRREPCRQSMIRTISGRNTDEQIQNIRQLCHENIVKSVEIYACSDAGYYLISEFMPTSLMHLCRAPIYPNEPQLSSILHQVLSGVEFLLAHGFVHEQLSCANILVNFDGDVKICDVERCTGSGDASKLTDSFCRVLMRLMDKEKNTAAVVGLTRPGDWSQEAVDLFTLTTAGPSVKQLLSHEFMGKKNKQELVWLIPLVLITAHYSRE